MQLIHFSKMYLNSILNIEIIIAYTHVIITRKLFSSLRKTCNYISTTKK